MDKRILKIRELEHWFTVDFVIRMESIRRCQYLGITPLESEYDLQMEAYAREQEYRRLTGKQLLPERNDLINI